MRPSEVQKPETRQRTNRLNQFANTNSLALKFFSIGPTVTKILSMWLLVINLSKITLRDQKKKKKEKNDKKQEPFVVCKM